MSSRLDPYFKQIFEMLNKQGYSYHAVCEQLKFFGVNISRQALWSWHTRRTNKLLERSKKLAPTFNLEEKYGSSLRSPESNNVLKNLIPTVSARNSSLTALIECEEKLHQSPFKNLSSAYLIKTDMVATNKTGFLADSITEK